MTVRLVISLQAKPGKGAEFAKLQASRCPEVEKEPGCQQFEVFQSVLDPDKFALLELWDSQKALDEHLERMPIPQPSANDLRVEGPAPREDYEYNRTR